MENLMFKELTDEEAFLTEGGGWLTWVGIGVLAASVSAVVVICTGGMGLLGVGLAEAIAGPAAAHGTAAAIGIGLGFLGATAGMFMIGEGLAEE